MFFDRNRNSGEQLVTDLMLFEAQDQEAIQKTWSTLSGSKQQDADLEVDKQSQRNPANMAIPADEGDVPALRNE